MLTLRRRQSAKPLGRRLVAERTQGVTRNSEMAQVLGRMLTLPIAVLREILQYLDTKVIISEPRPVYAWVKMWSGTWRMINSLRLRRRMGQESYLLLDNPNYRFLDHTPTFIILDNTPNFQVYTTSNVPIRKDVGN